MIFDDRELTKEQREELIAEAKHYYFAAPTILPLIEKQRQIAFSRLLAAYRAGEFDLLRHVAELSAVVDLETAIKMKQNFYKNLEEGT